MPTRGPQVFGSLQQARIRIQNSIRELDASAVEFDQKMDRLVSRRSTEFVELARHYLPELSNESAQRAFDEVRADLLDLFEKKQQHQRELSHSIEQLLKTIDQAQTETKQVTIELNQKAIQRDRLQELAADQLRQIPEFEQLTNDAARAEQRLTQNESRMDQLNDEAKKNLPSFNKSHLFRYLHDRRFGTAEYRSRGLIRRIDRWLARYIDYAKARRNYEFLTTTPLLMSAELQRRREQFDQLMERIETMESRIEQEVGLTDVIVTGDRLGEQRERLVATIDVEHQRLMTSKSELETLQQSNGQYYDEALSKMRDHLQATEAVILQLRARKTDDPGDDRIVNDILELNGLIGELQPGILRLVGERRTMNERQTRLDDVIRRFRSSNFDSDRSVFPDDFHLDHSINRFLNNEIDTASLWNQIRSGQTFLESWAQQTSTDLLSNPSAQIVLHTMFNLATQALKNSARRSVYRRGSSGSGGFSWPTPTSSTHRTSPSPKKSSGFTTGNGF